MDTHVSRLRVSYNTGELTEDAAGPDPLRLFASWMGEAIGAGIPEPNGMALATVNERNEPSVRIVLLRGYDERGFVFYTNYESAKAEDLAANPRAALTFWWHALYRQIRIAGVAQMVAREESEAYFATRPRGHQLSAWASPQSRLVKSRAALERNATAMRARFADAVPLPGHWGGYRVAPASMEFWQGRENRLHDRLLYTLAEGAWLRTRLAP
ncbi:MAG: pyridoxamine 5'-phosphate oxidase [Acidobacteria bacterium]|nr:pyridoxamine 5'-phosphate oxidase [Acidobacteriota bacterium]